MWQMLLALTVLVSFGCKYEMNLHSRAKKEDPKDKATTGNDSPKESPKSLRGCTTEAVQKVIRAHMSDITRCYRKGLAKDPQLAGRVLVVIQIGQNGKAKSIGVKENTLGNKDVANCIVQELKPLAYPYPGKELCTIFYPFQFSAAVKK
jgi:hypothetical protein